MKKYLSWLLLVAMFCMVTAGGCGGGHDGDTLGDDSGSTEYLNEECSGETGDQQGEDVGRGGSGSDTIKVKVDGPTAYYFKSVSFHGRKDGGKWETLYSKTDGGLGDEVIDRDFEFEVSKEYVEFGFEFDVLAGTDYPYSGVFLTAEDTAKTQPEKINIKIRGTTFNASIKISVNDIEVFEDSNCDSHTPYGWNDIRLEFSPCSRYWTQGTIL